MEKSEAYISSKFCCLCGGFTTYERKLTTALEVQEFAAIRWRRGSRDMEMVEVERHLADICLR